MSAVSLIGLVLIVLTVIVFVVLLADDLYRVIRGRMTFTEWADQKAYRQWLFVAGAGLLPAGMILHLFG